MFRDGNNQAMQLVMQGYSDSIKAKTSNQGTAMANAFGQGLSNAVQTHDNHEQAMQNREMTRLQNEYMNKTMDDRVRHQAQQTKANDLANEYTERTLDDRVAHQEQQTIANGLANEGQWLNNNYQAQVNKEQLLTSKGRVKATDSQNYANAAAADKQKTITELEHAAYHGTEQPLQDEKGNYYLARYDKEKGQSYRKYIHEDDAKRRIETNAQVAATKKAATQGETSMQQARTAELQAQTAQNINNMNMQNQQKAQFDEAMGAIQASGDTYNDIFYKLGEAARNNEPEITLGNGTKMSVEMANIVAHGMGRGNGGGIGGGINISNKNDMTFKEQLKGAVETFQNPNATEEELNRARATIANEKHVIDLYKRIGNYALAAEQMEQISGQDRLDTFIGFLGQYVGGTNAKVYGELSAAQSNILTSLGTSALKGALSDMDMKIIRKQVSDLRKAGSFNEGVLVSALNKMIKDIEYNTENFGGVRMLTPKAQAQYNSFVKLRQALVEK